MGAGLRGVGGTEGIGIPNFPGWTQKDLGWGGETLRGERDFPWDPNGNEWEGTKAARNHKCGEEFQGRNRKL